MELETVEQKESYAFGLDVGGQLSQFLPNLNTEAFFTAMQTVFQGMEPKISKEDYQEFAKSFQEKAQATQKEAAEKMGEAQNAEGKFFLEQNKAKEGVVETESGLQYKVLTEGTGSKPANAEAKVEVHYEGRLLNGQVFDSSYQRGEPISFALNGVIKGWTEGVQLMSIGSTYEFYIPSDLAYGAQGAGGSIPPHSTLIFKVELLGIES